MIEICYTNKQMDDQPSHTQPSVSCRGRCLAWLHSINFYVYCSHTLSAWGDRMWWFAVGLFLFKLEEDTLQLTAIYSFTICSSILLLGSLIGSWVDKYPRLRVAQVALVVQNSAVILSAVILCLIFSFKQFLYSSWNGWLATLSHVLIILVADIARMGSVASSVAIQKDWVVVICRGNKTRLANLNAVMRRIDLLTNILAPIVTGQIMTYGSMFGGALFIAGWNLVSVFIEYYLLWKVYQNVPLLATKGMPTLQELEEDNPKSIEMKDIEVSKCMSQEDLNKNDKSEDVVGVEKCSVKGENDSANSDDKPAEVDDVITSRDDVTNSVDDVIASRDDVTNSADIAANTKEETACDEERKFKTNSEEPHSSKLDGDGQATAEDKLLEETTAAKLDIKPKPKKSAVRHIFSNFFTIIEGWRVYMRQDTVFAGLGLAMLFMTVLGFDVITSAYGYSQGLTESILGICMALGALTGIIGTVIFQHLRSKVGLERTGLFATATQVGFLSLCVLSVWLPGSPFDLSYDGSHGDQNNTLCANSSVAVPQDTPVNQTLGSCVAHGGVRNYASVIVFFVGIVFSRCGLWMLDLTITQIVQENVAEHERGVVGGVQNSFNMLLDMLKNVMVILAPRPQTFGIPIIISFCFVTLGGMMYSMYSRKVRGHLLPICMHENGNHKPNAVAV